MLHLDFASYNRDNELAKRITEENAPNFVLPGTKWLTAVVMFYIEIKRVKMGFEL